LAEATHIPPKSLMRNSAYRLSGQPTMKNDGSLMAWLSILIADAFEVASLFRLENDQ
jgi:hypothetical protein